MNDEIELTLSYVFPETLVIEQSHNSDDLRYCVGHLYASELGTENKVPFLRLL